MGNLQLSTTLVFQKVKTCVSILFLCLPFYYLQAQCPTDCTNYSTEIDLDLLPDCSIDSESQSGNLDGTMQDACFVNDDPNALTCHEFIFTRDDASTELQIQFRVGQGSMCTGDLDDAYQIVENGTCIEFPEAMSSQTMASLVFPEGVSNISFYACKASSSFITICDLCIACTCESDPSIIDNSPPSLTVGGQTTNFDPVDLGCFFLPADVTILPPPKVIGPVSDNCVSLTPDDVTVTDDFPGVETSLGSGDWEVTRTYSVDDDCDNNTSLTETFEYHIFGASEVCPSANCILDPTMLVVEDCVLPEPITDMTEVFEFEAFGMTPTMDFMDIGDTDVCDDLAAIFVRTYTLYLDGMPFITCSQEISVSCLPEVEMSCRSHVQVSLDEECHAEVTAEMILSSETFCPDRFLVELYHHDVLITDSPWVSYDWIGYTLTTKVIDLWSGNSCWGEITVEDKMPPVFTTCDDITVVNCFDAESYHPEAIDNCDGPVVPELISETFTPYDCDSDDDGTYTKTIHRVYQATDSHGNVSEPCTVNIQLRRIVLDDIDWPANSTEQCGTEVYSDENGVQVLDPGYYQVPKINGIDLYPLPNIYCNLSVTFQDMELETINCVTKTMRVWTVREWFCDAEDMRSNPQFIEVVDSEGPLFDCPADQTVSTNGYSCEMDVYIERPDAVDACDNGIKHIDLEFPGGFRSDWQGGYLTLPDGMHELTFIAYDDCHNSSSCSFYISVVDDTAPVAVCDEFTVVSVTLDGEAEVHAASFDDGSYDDCQVKSMLVRRMDGDCPDCQHPKYDGFDYLGDYDGHYYYLSHYKFRGDKSLKIAQAMGGYAASIGSLEENTWVFDAVQGLNSDTEYWIGFNDVDVEGEFVWSNGEDVTYTNWNPEMPNNLHPGQDYVKVPHWDGGRWYDTEFDQEHRFVLEVDDPCTWSSYEQFCCADIGEDVMVGFRVLDRWGNYNDCMVTVEVQDKLPPHIYCPPDLTITCGYDYVSMDVFGTVRKSEDEVQEISVPEEYLVNASGPLYDGYSYDNCFVRVLSDPIAVVNQCGIGYIERTFTAIDAGGRETSCVQRIDIVNTNPFDSLDIRWPGNEDMTGCEFPEDYPPEVTGVPTFVGEDECDLVASTFEDEVYPFNDPVGDACFKILRTWTVIDWCQREVNDKYMWSHTQIIKINNTRAPEFTSSCGSTSTCTYDGTCADGYIELIMTARDDCTEDENLRWEWQVDAYSDGTYNAAGNSNDASGEYPIGRHIIKWTVEDKCGNKTTCEQLFLIENCKPATPYCLRGLAVDLMPQDLDNDGVADWGMIVVWAEDFDAGSSHPCEELDVQLAFSPDPTDIYIEFDCSDIGEHFIDLYAITQTSTGPVWSYCTATIDIQDNMFVCPNDGRATVSGLITTENDEPVIGVSVDLEGSELEAVSTDETGTYAFPEMLMGGTYAVHPTRNIDPMNGVSTLDLVLMQRHILGIETLDSPYKVIAADVNHDEKLSAVDMLELRKLILGISEEYSNNESWRFVERDYTFENPVDPLVEGFPEIYFIGDLNHDFEVDFIGLKVGDVSGDASPNEYHSTEIRGNNPFELYIEDQLVEAGESVRLAIKAGEDTDVMGYQFTLNTNGLIASLEGIESGNIDVSEDNFGLHKLADGLLTTSWNQMSAKALKEGDVLFSIDLIVHEAGLLSQMIELNSSITMAEAYDSNREVRALDLNFRTDYGQVLESAKLLQNIPNPFSTKTMVKFYLPTQMDASLLIYDVNGRLIEQIQENYEKGYHEIEISNTQLNGNGVFYYTLQAGEFMATKKMVLLK